MRLAILLLTALPACAQIDEARELAAIRKTEHSFTEGARHEIGFWQMAPFNYDRFTGTDYERALGLLREFERDLPKIGMPTSEYTLALAWNCGITKLARREIPDSAVRYARRVRKEYLSR
jgi:phage major head subunit gpT-like protein